MCDRLGYSVFNEIQNNEIQFLRQVWGAHKDINLIRWCSHLGLIVTCTINGDIGVWGLDSSVLLAYLIGHTD